jgi:hypothetical protein
MDAYEQLVESYLTIFEHLAIIPQFPVLFDEKDQPRFHETPGTVAWAAFPDFLAIDTRNREAHLVEVNKSVGSGLLGLVDRTVANRERVEAYTSWFASDGFAIRWRFFVRRRQVEGFSGRLAAAGIKPDVTALEDVFDRLRDLMP